MTKEEKNLALTINHFWTSFATTGIPQSRPNENIPSWPQYNNKTDLNIILDMDIQITSGLKNLLCNFWDSIIYAY